MKIKRIIIRNFASCEDIRLDCESLHAFVGANNAGKSNILRALDFFFNPSAPKISKDTFWNHDLGRQIWVDILFVDLTDQERAQLGAYLRPDGVFHMARSVTREVNEESPDELKVKISQHYSIPMPKLDWLCETKINGERIKEWWAQRDTLIVGGHNFGATLGTTRPSVQAWKTNAAEFVRQHLTAADMTYSWADNPQGYANVLKGTLPHFILVPAVRDLTDEAKVTKTSPFGRLLYEVVASVTEDQRARLDGVLAGLRNQLNREGGDGRLGGVVRIEQQLNAILSQYMACDLEIEFQPPTLELLLTTPRLYADDGFRNTVEAKGHGLQRAIIFSILRCYAETVTGSGDARRRGFILAVEEPETYMHPQAQRTNRRVFLQLAAAGDQVFFSTHSGLMLDVARFDEIIRVEGVAGELEGNRVIRSKVWQLSMDRLIADVLVRHPGTTPTPDSMRELYMNAYHPNRSEGCFARKVILVEGATEQYALQIYADALRYRLDELNIAIVDCGGKGSMDRLYRVFNELGIACFMLFDFDRDSIDLRNPEKSRGLLELVGENPATPTDVVVHESVACFPTKWEDTLKSEVPEMDAITTAAREAMGLGADSGKPLVARFMARQLTQATPPAVPPSIRRILDSAVNVQRRRSCLRGGAPAVDVAAAGPPDP